MNNYNHDLMTPFLFDQLVNNMLKLNNFFRLHDNSKQKKQIECKILCTFVTNLPSTINFARLSKIKFTYI